MTRSRSSAKRVRLLAAVATLLAILGGLAGIAGGVLLATFRRIDPGVTLLDGTVINRSVTYPYVWVGVGVGVGSVVLMVFLLLLVESARMRAHVVLEGHEPPRAATATSSSHRYAAMPAPPIQPVQPRAAASANGRRVLVLSEAEKARLSRTLPPRPDEGWYPDPLDASSLRRWNGAQWTGEQQAIALPGP